MKIIGLTTNANDGKNSINQAYIKAFTTENTIPMIIPVFSGKSSELFTQNDQDYLNGLVDKLLPMLDGLVLTGGNDVNPTGFDGKFKHSTYTNYNRDAWEWTLANKFMDAQKPVVGICRGFQLLGLLNGLELTQELSYVEKNDEIHNGNSVETQYRDEPIHEIDVCGDFKEWLGTDKLRVNSFHHQGFILDENKSNVDKNELEIISKTEKVIEGFRHKTLPMIAFQYHPEEFSNSLTIKYIINKLFI